MSSKDNFGTLRVDWNPSTKKTEFEFSLKNLPPTKTFELIIINDANFLEGQLFV